MRMTSAETLAEMIAMGVLTSLVAPVLIVLTRRRWHALWTRLTTPAPLAAVPFVVAHSAMVIWMGLGPEPGPSLVAQTFHAAVHVALFAGALLYWLPVLSPQPRLSPAARCVYLFLTAPALDLSAVIVVAGGHSAAGLSMIVSMLPIGLCAVWLTWRWISAEELAVAAFEANADQP
jgi:cytochrome c oxidase assembly factor CtaG